jgi:sulfoxide reductase heme-binding subunit YedZ
MRLSGRSFVLLVAVVAIVLVYATGQIAPADTPFQAQMRVWLAARATGIATLVLLTLQVLIGLVLSHPTNQTTWKLSKRFFPWHENVLVFIAALLLAHVVTIVVDPFAGVGLGGALLPGLSEYRSAPVALGTLGMYALAVTAVSARYTRLLPAGVWLKLHRLSLVVLILSWLHGLLAGTDSDALRPLYVVSMALVLAAGAHRYWVIRRERVSARQAASPRPAPAAALPTVPAAIPIPVPSGGDR